MSTAACRPRRELAHRVNGGIEVTLYWCAEDNSTSIEVWQPSSEERFAFVVPGEHALDAFNHPFAHLRTTRGELSPAAEACARS
jgi:hypothetical protein